jgi:hypothetical protein
MALLGCSPTTRSESPSRTGVEGLRLCFTALPAGALDVLSECVPASHALIPRHLLCHAVHGAEAQIRSPE